MKKGREDPDGWRWVVRPLVVCVLLAVLTTVAFAWALESFGPLFITEQCDFDEHYAKNGAMWVQYDCFGGCAVEIYALRMSPAAAKQYFATMPAVVAAEPPGWVIVPFNNDEGAKTCLRGWPLTCLYYEARWPQSGPGTDRLLGHARFFDLRFRLPLGVRWLGMIADVAFFAAIFAAIGIGPRAVRHARRRRAGHCASCNYDRRGLAAGALCPECGAGAMV